MILGRHSTFFCLFLLLGVILLRSVTLAAVRAGGASASTGGDSFFLVFDDPYRDECEYCKQYQKNCYRTDIRGKKLDYSCHNLYLDLKL